MISDIDPKKAFVSADAESIAALDDLRGAVLDAAQIVRGAQTGAQAARTRARALWPGKPEDMPEDYLRVPTIDFEAHIDVLATVVATARIQSATLRKKLT